MTDTHLSEASNSNSSILNKPMLRRTYKDAVNALNSLQSNFATIDAVRKSGINRSPVLIPEMIEWARRIGYKPSDLDKLNIVHVTGTKGKGSTCAFVNSILSQFRSPATFVRSGVSPVIAEPEATSPITTTTTASSAPPPPPPSTLGTSRITKIGLYTSPHLKSVRERIMINGKPVSEELFARYFFEVWDRLDKSTSDTTVFPHMGPGVKPAYFRYLTLLSFHTFIREGVDSAVFEVGIGGEYDSTNIIEHPTACGIATLGLDHTQVLGNTLESIAWNKSGIFKPGSACFSVRQTDEAATKMIEERAKEKQVGSFEWVDVRPDVQELKLGINGDFQVQNASLAVALCYAHLQKLGFNIDTDTLPDQFINGLEQARWPGRCQVLPDKLRNDLIWYIDGAHTKESIEGSTHWFTTVTNPERSRVLLFNQQTRDPERLLNVLHNEMEKGKLRFDHVVFTTNVTWSSGDYSEDLVSLNTSSQQVDSLQVQTLSAEIWNKLDKKSRKHIFHDIETGVNFIRSLEGPLDVFVCGSLHLVGGFLVVLESKEGKMVNGL
ncbi:DEKNAAC105130 [Brettanomyces naardenensis]|uniref:Folylpolyglutamate synthase n=1 Tax=Brettanomyces naardenensis TaxID=13370 RepID=A0A448YSZ1_BRENA|nr:DEKNAAC105130 [Brettanomyces naardenensis]